MSTERYSGLLVELDCLLDTRLGTLATYFSEETVLHVLKHGYHDREFDVFDGVDYDEFMDHYRNRGRTVLQNSIRTNFIPMMTEFIQETLNNNVNTPHIYLPKIIVNIYPYHLNTEEIRLIRDVVIKMTRQSADVELINLPHSELTPGYLETEVSAMALYDYDQWLEAQSLNDAFRKKACPQIGLFAPALYKKRALTDEDRRIHSQLKMPPFEYLARQLAPFIRTIFIPVSMFSIPARMA